MLTVSFIQWCLNAFIAWTLMRLYQMFWPENSTAVTAGVMH